MPEFVNYGYVVNGPASTTPTGISVPLRKFGSALYGQAIQDIVFEVSIISESSVRVKV
jgi:hypothetical protein